VQIDVLARQRLHADDLVVSYRIVENLEEQVGDRLPVRGGDLDEVRAALRPLGVGAAGRGIAGREIELRGREGKGRQIGFEACVKAGVGAEPVDIAARERQIDVVALVRRALRLGLARLVKSHVLDVRGDPVVVD